MWKIASLLWLLVGFGVNDAIDPIGRQWNISTKTLNIGHAASNAGVHIILIEADGRRSPPILLDNILLDDFEPNSVDQFIVDDKVIIKDVCYITIYHDNTGEDPDWFLEKVWMIAAQMKNDRVFNIDRWVPTEQEARASHYEVKRTPPCSEGPLD